MRFINIAVIFVAIVPSVLSQVDGDPLDSAINTNVYPPPTATPADISGHDGASPYYITATDKSVPTGSAGTKNILGTYLYGYHGCNKINRAYKRNIDEAYYDSWTIASTPGVLSDINWNEAPDLEFLGAPGLNKPQQAQIQAVFANLATVIYSYKSPFQHALHVRCDDPLKKCQNRPDKDPCQPNPPNPDQKPKPTPLAYARNQDPNDDYPMINFCEGFFKRRSLSNAIAYGTALKSPDNLRLNEFDNRAQTFFHELTHLDFAADSPHPNHRVNDLTIAVKTRRNSLISEAYGTLLTKILARYQKDTGYYTQQNADNLAYFALAKYVMTKNKNIYPHLPITINEIDGPPWIAPPATIAEFITEGGSTYLNVSAADLSALGLDNHPEAGGDLPGCPDNENQGGSISGTVLNIDSLAPDSAYPPDYISTVSSWVASLSAITTNPTITKSPSSATSVPPSTTSAGPPAYATGTCSFHLKEWQDCESYSSNLFEASNMLDNNRNDIGDTPVDSKHPLGEPINAANPYHFITKLPYPLIIVGEHEHDYVQFSYNGLQWTSRTTTGPATCKVGGWDPRDGPICGQRFGNRNALNQMDCSFPC